MMGKDLHPMIIDYAEKLLSKHSAIQYFEKLSNKDYYMYKIVRNEGRSELTLLLDDSYHFGHVALLNALSELPNGGIILIAKPEANYPDDEPEVLKDKKVLIGKIGIVIGALNWSKFWQYKKPEKKQSP